MYLHWYVSNSKPRTTDAVLATASDSVRGPFTTVAIAHLQIDI